LGLRWLAALRRAYDWSVAGQDGDYFSDVSNPDALPHYQEFLAGSPIADIIAELWGTPHVWFMYEQVFLRRAALRPTMWHQDLSYLAAYGDHLAVAWFSFEEHDRRHGLEFVRGSHLGSLYNGISFDPNDPTAPFYDTEDLPRMPDIDGRREIYDIVSFDYQPGDVIVFHPKTMHGGGGTTENHRERRSVSLRFFGRDAVYAARPGPCGPRYPEVHAALRPGEPFRHPRFPALRPLPASVAVG
jgi:ectoine hydroxylase-related dioxygenase (phytanoyl-CoA dioxygenase family)